jgi:hypothetical protein
MTQLYNATIHYFIMQAQKAIYRQTYLKNTNLFMVSIHNVSKLH